jgi:2-(3-amino-3-carboxypropyl)histidine synthase
MEADRAETDLGIAADIEEAQAPEPVTRQPKKRFVGRRTAAEAAASKNGNGSGSIEDAGAVQGTVACHVYISLFS